MSEALDIFKKLVILAPESSNWWYNLGLVSRESGEFQAAHEAYLRAIEIAADDADTWLELGLCEIELEPARSGSARRWVALSVRSSSTSTPSGAGTTPAGSSASSGSTTRRWSG